MDTPECEGLLHAAVEENDLRAVERRLAAGDDVNGVVDGETPLHIASRKGHVALVNILLQSGGDIYVPTTYRQETALFLASMEGKLEVVRTLVEKTQSLTQKERTGALLAASRYGHYKIVHFLLGNKDLDMEALWGNGQTALTMATRHGHARIVRLLLKAGCSINHPDQRGLTALATAVMYRHSELIPILMAAGASISSPRSLLHMASSNGDLESVQELLSSTQCEVDSEEQGRTALYVACEMGFLDVVQELLEAGADPNRETGDTGDTAVFAAMETPLISLYLCPDKSVMKIICALIRAGCNPSRRNKAGQTPLEVALRKKLSDAALLFLAAECTATLQWWSSCQNQIDTYTMDSECPHLLPMLVVEMTSPRSLKRLCRRFFRGQLASTLPYAASIARLPLPKTIKNYLCYEDVYDV